MPAFRHQHRHLGLDSAGDPDHLIGRRHFQIQLDVRQLAQMAHIGVLDMAPVLTQMYGNSIRTAQVGFHRRPNRIGFVGLSRLADCGDVVDIYAEFDHFKSRIRVRVCNILSPKR